MAHPIRMTKEQIKDAMATFHKLLTDVKTPTGQVQLNYSLTAVEDTKATLKITELAWKKITALVDECSKEIAWHGTVHKDRNTYTIEDIIVFPQTVTGATVTTDETEYSMWLAQQTDEVFNHLRFHGHSHVNMGVSPSGTDLTYQSDMLKNVKDFYIYAIFNKKGANWCVIYDVEDNIVYEDSDIILDTPDTSATAWAKEQMEQYVQTYTPTTYRGSASSSISTATHQQTEEEAASSYTEEFINRYYDKSGKKKSQQELEEEEMNERFHQQTFDDYYGGVYGGGYGGRY